MKTTARLTLLAALIGAAQFASAQAFYPPPGFTGTVIGDNQISNGKFDSALTPWSGTGWEWNSGKARHLTGTTALTSSTPSIVSGYQYRLTYTVSSATTGTITPSLGGITLTARSTNATFVDYVVAASTAAISFTPSSSFDGRVDDIEMVRISEGQLIVDGTTTMHGGLVINGPVTQIGTGYTNSFTAGTGGIQSGTQTPATCNTGDAYIDTDATAGSNFYVCTAANNWVLQGGLADPGGNGIVVRTATGVSTNRSLTAGDGISVSAGDGQSGNPTASVNSSVSRKGSGSGVPPTDCGNSGNTYQSGDTYLDTATNTLWICETARSSNTGSWWPLTHGKGAAVIADDFCGNSVATNAIGADGWSVTSIGGGSTLVAGNGLADTPCVIDWQESTSGDGVVIGLRNFLFSSATTKDWYLELEYIPGSSGGSSIANTAIYFGMGTGSPLAASAGIWIRRDTGLGDSTYVFAICDSATTGCQAAGDDVNQKVVTSTVTPTTGVKANLRIWHLNSGVGSASTFYFSVDGETPKTFCASGCDDDITQLVASGNLNIIIVFIDQTNASKNMSIDFFRGYYAVTR